MEQRNIINTSKVRLHLNGTEADKKYDLWELRRKRTADPRKRYVSCEEMFEVFRGKACIRGMIRGYRAAYVATEHGRAKEENLQEPENTTIRRVGWSDLDECDALRMLFSCLADRSDETECDEWTHFNLDGALRQIVEIKDKSNAVVTLEHSITREGDALVWNADVKTFTQVSYLRDRDFSKSKPKETYPRFMLHEGKIIWAHQKDKRVNDDNSYLLRVRKGNRKRNMVDALAFDARETKEGKLMALRDILRLFDLCYGKFARLEWLGVPQKDSIPINVIGKSLRKANGKITVDGLEDCGQAVDEVRQALHDAGVETNGSRQGRIMILHEADYYRYANRDQDTNTVEDPYQMLDRSIPTQCISVEMWNRAKARKSDSMRKALVASALNELRIKQEVVTGTTDDSSVRGYCFAVPCKTDESQETKGIDEPEPYLYLKIGLNGRFEFHKDTSQPSQPSFEMGDFMIETREAVDSAGEMYGARTRKRVECVVRNPDGNVAAITRTSMHAMPTDLNRLIKEIDTIRSEAGRPRSEKTAHPRSKEFAGKNYPSLLGINIGEDDDGTTLYSVGYQNTNLNKRMPRMVPIRRIIQVEGENFDDQIIDMCNVDWVRSTYLPSVLPWPVKYLREMDRNGIKQF